MSRQSDPGFWTSCPACCHVHQYSRRFLNLKLRCPSCRRPFAAVELPSPPPVVPGTDMYYCTWGFFPLGFQQGQGGATPAVSWTPVMPWNEQPSTSVDPQPSNRAPVKTTARKKVLVSKRAVNGGAVGVEDEEVFRGIDVNEAARVSDLMAGAGDQHSDAIGFNIDVDVGAASEDVFGIW